MQPFSLQEDSVFNPSFLQEYLLNNILAEAFNIYDTIQEHSFKMQINSLMSLMGAMRTSQDVFCC